YELTRFAVLRLLAFVYLAAFASLAAQMEPLIGSRGLLPAGQFLAAYHARLGGAATWRLPTLFWLGASDGVLRAACYVGIALSVAALLGVSNAIVQLALWVLYLSFVHVGQIFFGYGWETQLLETGLLAALLCPVRSVRPLPKSAVPRIVIWLLRWLIFRVMIGAALIKLRNDPCWRDLTCLDYHFETQPNPNPLAWWFHHAPAAVHALGVAFNFLVELVAPWFAFGFRRWRHAAGVLFVSLQAVLILSGNLSFLNWLTIVPALACFDDTLWVRLVPRGRRFDMLARFAALAPARAQTRAAGAFAVVVLVLSVGPVANLASCDQAMNRSFDPLDVVNTYGAFGSVDRKRYEVILEGTRDAVPDDAARWREYELPCMPGDPRRRPCVVTPYHYRLDWQMWFA
ncbi:MAG: lipase maturation factor family protein, partial [Polyangiaceae bacterium]